MRLHIENEYIKNHSLEGMTGLELESHRINREGRLAQTPHPFPGNRYIDRDFSEAQIEINTPPAEDPYHALQFLDGQLAIVHEALDRKQELLWPFSNPPVIRSEDDIRVARFTGDQLPSYHYRLYLAERYGKYKMTYSGIHFNYSFAPDLLRENYEIDRAAGAFGGSLREYRDRFYLRLAEKVLCYSWAVVSLLAASPVVDNSFYEAGAGGKSIFTGFSSLRCSEFGYWNQFLPVLSYESVEAYTDSISDYLKQGLLIQARELYYPVRIKPPGKYTLDGLRENGVSHIELRQIDLNPFERDGVDPRDMQFLRLFLVWLASLEMAPLEQKDQMQAIQNHKSAAAYDWDIARVALPGEKPAPLRAQLIRLLDAMELFYSGDAQAVREIRYQKEKTADDRKRYAARVRDVFGSDYIGEGIRRAREIQEAFHV